MLVPYILSSRSNKVVSRVLGGLRPNDFDFVCAALASGFVCGNSSSAIILSPSKEPSKSESLRVKSSIEMATDSAVSTPCNDSVLPSFFGSLVLGAALVFFFFSCLSIDRIVGGSCIGSPAKINFFALNMGIQQT